MRFPIKAKLLTEAERVRSTQALAATDREQTGDASHEDYFEVIEEPEATLKERGNA